MVGRGFSLFVVTANAAGAVYYLAQGRIGLATLLGAVAAALAWIAFRPPSRRTTFHPVRTLVAGAAFFGVVLVLMLAAVAGAETRGQAQLGGVGAAVAAVLFGLALWAVVRARRMGYGWSSELERRQRPDV